jgi:hypothetical protein
LKRRSGRILKIAVREKCRRTSEQAQGIDRPKTMRQAGIWFGSSDIAYEVGAFLHMSKPRWLRGAIGSS